ncbi:MAG: flavin reductase family protein [Salinirussus sp.]
MTDGDELRAVMGSFATGVTVATLAADEPHGLTANAVSSVSLDPPLVLLCIDRETTSYEKLEAGDASGYCLNILTADQQDLGEYFAGMAEFDESPFETRPTTTAVTGAPIFEECLGYIDCTVWEAYPGGDHVIYVGEVEEAAVLDETSDPLTFFRGGWGTIA